MLSSRPSRLGPARPRHDAARGLKRERRPTTTPRWSAGRRFLAFPPGSHPDGIPEGASQDGTRNPVLLWRAATARAGFASLRLPTGGLAALQPSPAAPF